MATSYSEIIMRNTGISITWQEKNIFFVFGIHVYTRDRYLPDEPNCIKSHKAETERHSIALKELPKVV